jgi:hypothetical protein
MEVGGAGRVRVERGVRPGDEIKSNATGNRSADVLPISLTIKTHIDYSPI